MSLGRRPRTAPAAPATVPDAPTSLTATVADAEVTLNWTAPANDGGATIINYIIEYSLNEDFSSSTTAEASTLSYTVSGLANGTLYYFRVAAVNSAGTGASGTAVSATPAPAAPATVPDAPTSLTATVADAEVTLNWTAPANDGGATIINYIIEYSLNEDFSSSTTAEASTLSYTVSGLANGTLYYFRVAAVNSAGTGASGTAVSATPAPAAPATVPDAPTSLTATAADAEVTLKLDCTC